MRTWKEPKLGTGRIRVRRDTWRTTICRLIRAEQEAVRSENLMNAALDAGDNILQINNRLRKDIETAETRGWRDALRNILASVLGYPDAGGDVEIMSAVSHKVDAARQQGREDVLRLIARWGKARPLEGMGGADMAEALRKVLTPTIAPERYTSTEIERLPHGQHVVTHKSEPEPTFDGYEIDPFGVHPK